MTDTQNPDPTQSPRGKQHFRRVMRVLLWLTGVPAILILLLYAALLFGPFSLPFLRDTVHSGVANALPPGVSADFGDVFIALEGGLPVVKAAPVQINDRNTGAEIKMDALDVGFSPVRAIIGQPVLNVTMVKPHVQIIQDLFGPRLAGFEVVEDKESGDAAIWVIEGEKSLPSVRISSDGLDVRGVIPEGSGAKFRSDNDWLIYNLKATIDGLLAFKGQTDKGTFSRFRVQGGVLEMHDSVYGLLRQFNEIQLDIAPNARGDAIRGTFSANLAGKQIDAEIEQVIAEDGTITFASNVKNLDFASLLPFIDDQDGILAVKGVGSLGISVTYSPKQHKFTTGLFDVDLTGTSLRVQEDLFPVKTAGWEIEWRPDVAQFQVESADIAIGKSSGLVSGVFVMGIDDTYGPTLSISLEAQNVVLHPNDMASPETGFDEMAFTGWSAPLYGAVGIDQLIVRRPGMLLRAQGRTDLLRTGIGIDLEMGGEGASADDLKRLWPYFISTGARDWFVANVLEGQVETASMRLKFPVGSMSVGDEDKPVPDGALSIDVVGTDVKFRPMDTMDPVAVQGKTRVQVRDNVTTASLDAAEMVTDAGVVSISNPAFIVDTKRMNAAVFEISGDVKGDIPALLALTKSQAPDALANFEAPLDINALTGSVSGALVATVVSEDVAGITSIDYAANGTVSNFASAQPIEGYSVNSGDLTFSATSDGYVVRGDLKLADIEARLDLDGKVDGDPNLVVSAELSVDELKSLGFDTSQFLNGKIRFAAKPLNDGALRVTADLKAAGITLTDLGLQKKAGSEGMLNAEVRIDGDDIDVDQVMLKFGTVDLRGKLAVSVANGLKSAELTTFRLSEGDDASLVVTPIDNGVALKLRGGQLDLKPMLKRFFALDQASTGGPQSTQFDQALSLDVELSRALGFYSTVGYNLDLKMDLVGEDLRDVSMQAQFAEGNSVSVATNRTQAGRTMLVAFNDAGTLLRFVNAYSRLLGGEGSLTLARDVAQKLDNGVLSMRNFSLVDEEKVVEILGNHRDSRKLIAAGNRLNFDNGQVTFIRSADRIEVVDAVLEGDTTGGTMRGFVYTKAREYDLAGTYVPIFALNSIFQKLPIIGQILGGRDGEGLVGVTFAIRGSLDNPQFLINPASVLLPGAFRSLMEFRAREKPAAVE